MDASTSRRAVLAGTGAAVASAGCVGRVRNIAGRNRPSQLTLELTTTPADEDPHAIRIARHLAENLSAVGVDARVNTMGSADLRRKVLLNHDFDLYVAQFPEDDPLDPDALYSLTHSSFAAETGWQNPFGFTELSVDELLDEQRVADDDGRPEVVAELQEEICTHQPFTVVAFPDALTAVRDGRFSGWDESAPSSVDGILRMEFVGDDSSETLSLRLATTDVRITENWNPIAAEYRRHGTFTSLLYDPLVRHLDDGPVPWLARDWEWTAPRTLRVDLREATWHDGADLTADDVAFTYAFLADTSMGRAESPVPAPKFRGRSSLVEETTVVDDGAVELTFTEVNRTVARRALEVPVLPEHVWSERTGAATIAGFEIDEETTEAVVWNNADPVGSGPLRFVNSSAEEEVVFERVADHFLDRTPDAIPEAYHGKPDFETLTITVAPSDIAAVRMVGDGMVDVTASNLGPNAVPRIGRESDARLVSTQSGAFYHVGYNVRGAPLSNPRFRAIVASLVDKRTLADEAFQGYAEPATSPLAASPEWVPERLRWDDETDDDPVHPFRGSDGELNAEAARDAFRDAGYRYNEAGELLARDQ